MTSSTPQPQTYARAAGGLYLLIALLGGFAYFMVSEHLFAPSDPAATAHNIAAQTTLFHLGLGAYVILLVLDVLVAWVLYLLFRSAAPQTALLAAWLRLAYVFVHAAALLSLLSIPRLAPEAAAQIQHAMAAHLDGFTVSLILFGAHLIVVGYLIARTRFLPRLFAVLLPLAALAYIVDGFALVLLPEPAAIRAAIAPYVSAIATLGEVGFLLWLLIKGVNVERWRAAAG